MFLSIQAGWLRSRSRLLRVAVGLTACGVFSGAGVATAETPPKPALRLALSDLGFPGYTISLMHAGASMATVHALDSSHVLFTYSLRSLVPRLPGDDANDTDRQVAAVLVEVPSGKVLARTKWRLHDHGRYLWSIGRGVFVVRSGSQLSLLAPLETMEKGEPLQRYALPHRAGTPVAVQGSPDGRILMVELEQESRKRAEDDEEDGHRPKHYILEFFRIAPAAEGKGQLTVSGAGAIGSTIPLHLPIDGDGYLWAEDGERGKWMISFNEFGGRQEKLAPVMSSCHPRLSLLSRAEFLVETCRGSDQQPMLASYGFDGHENWEEPFGETLQPPVLALAPEVGRFAMSRLTAASSGAPVSGLGAEDTIAQELRVYQVESGDMLFHLQCAPAVRSAENFDLSPDGKMLTVLGPETLDFYTLPGLSARDRSDLAEVRTMLPPEGTGAVVLSRITAPIRQSREVDSDALPSAGLPNAGSAAPAAAPASGSSTQSSASSRAAQQDPAAAATTASANGSNSAVSADAARKPPTLLNPGEHPEFKGQSSAPK